MRNSRKIARTDVMKALRGELKTGRYADGAGLYLSVRRGGSCQWIFLKMIDGKRSEITLGQVQAMGAAGGTDLSKIATASLEAARQAAADKQVALNAGADLDDLKKKRRINKPIVASSVFYSVQEAADVYEKATAPDGKFAIKRVREMRRLVKSLEAVQPVTKNILDFGFDESEKWVALRMKEVARSSVDRELRIIKSMFKVFIVKMRLQADFVNPFADVKLPNENSAVKAITKRLPLEYDEIVKIRNNIQSETKHPETSQIWDILTMTGARGAEIQALRISDVYLDHDIPHVKITPTDERGVKTAESVRWIPLYGIALDAAKTAYAKNKATGFLFGKSGKGEYGPVSQRIMNQLRKVTDDPRKVAYSLRHTLIDIFRENSVEAVVAMPFTGHTAKEIAEKVYGSPDKQMIRTNNAVKKILEEYSQTIVDMSEGKQ